MVVDATTRLCGKNVGVLFTISIMHIEARMDTHRLGTPILSTPLSPLADLKDKIRCFSWEEFGMTPWRALAQKTLERIIEM